MKKVMWCDQPAGSILLDLCQGSVQEKAGGNPDMLQPTLQPPGDSQEEARTCCLQEVAAKHSRSKCDHPGTLVRELGRGTCFHATFMAS